MLRNVKHLLHTAAYLPAEIKRFLDPKHPAILEFDPELGYIHRNHSMVDGLNRTRTVGTYHPKYKHRTMINSADKPCRINTYGDSYTQCAQVSDGETWQEVLAAHFGEPIRNFGVGGHGVYQATIRAMRMESVKKIAAEYIVLNIWDDDYMRNIDAARWIRVAWMCRDLPRGKSDGYPVHGFPWRHLRYNVALARWEERPGLCRKPEDLWKLVGKDNYYRTFKDDTVAHLYTLRMGGDAPTAELEALAEAFGLSVDLRSPKTRVADARLLHIAYGIRSTQFAVDKFRAWCEAHGRKLMILLSYDVPTVKTFIQDGSRFDAEFVRFLKKEKYLYTDTLPTMCSAYKTYRGTVEQFCESLYVERMGAQVFGHYSPHGNSRFAFSIKDDLAQWLDPKPLPYRG